MASLMRGLRCEIRNATGNIDGFQDQLENLGNTKTSGFDFGVAWTGPQTGIGQMSASWQNTYVKDFTLSTGTGLEPRTVGLELNNSLIPRLSSNLDLGWNLNDWNFHYRFRYLSGAKEDCASAAGFPICDSPGEVAPNRPDGTHNIGGVTYNDLRVTWKPTFGSLDITLTGGINNLFNKQPPICVSCSLNGYDASTYDIASRFAYVQASFKF